VLDGLWDFDDPAGSEARFRAALTDAPAGGTRRAELCTQLARAVGLQGRYDEAGELLDGFEPPTSEVPIVRVRLALERGRLLNSSGEPVPAIEHFREALSTAQSAGEEFLEVDAAHMLAIADRDHSEAWTQQALRTVAGSTDPRTLRWAGSLHNNAGWSRHDTGDYAGALAEFEAALAGYLVHGTVEQVRFARWAVARALRSLARFDEALEIQLRLSGYAPSDGYVEEELAELFLATGRPAEAREHAAAAADLLGADGWFAEYESGRLERLRQLARTA